MQRSKTVPTEERSRSMLERRQLLRGASGAAPILMTLASRPVTAAVCTPASSFASINASGRTSITTARDAHRDTGSRSSTFRLAGAVHPVVDGGAG